MRGCPRGAICKCQYGCQILRDYKTAPAVSKTYEKSASLFFAVVLGVACLIPAPASAYYYRGRNYPYYYRGHYYSYYYRAITTDITTTGTTIGIGLGSPGHGRTTAIGKRWILGGARLLDRRRVVPLRLVI